MGTLDYLRAFACMAVTAIGCSAAATVGSAEVATFIRIGTGATSGTYFPIGGLIANAISNPPGSRDCNVGGSCGVPGLIATAVSTQGSVANVIAVNAGELDMGLTQADVAYAAFSGKGVFAKDGPLKNLRAIANLFPESVHLVTRRAANIASVADLKGKRVSLGEPESGTLVVSEIILRAFGLAAKDLLPVYEKLGKAGDMLTSGELDAFFMVGGPPINAVAHAAEVAEIDLVSITGPEVERILKEQPFLSAATIPEGTYAGIGEIRTLGVGAQLVVSAAKDEALVQAITEALWHPNNRKVLDGGNPNAKLIRLETALDGVAIPLHPGAARFYEQIGLTRAGVF